MKDRRDVPSYSPPPPRPIRGWNMILVAGAAAFLAMIVGLLMYWVLPLPAPTTKPRSGNQDRHPAPTNLHASAGMATKLRQIRQ